ncbi:MAG: hypothetical protein J7L12_03680 [Desulfurococcales archaeon]|nr:hypothetical protein [Desulfurococcales archaeon]
MEVEVSELMFELILTLNNMRKFGLKLQATMLGLVILRAVKNKLEFNGGCSALGIAKPGLHRYLWYLSGKRKRPGDVVREALRQLEREEFKTIS